MSVMQGVSGVYSLIRTAGQRTGAGLRSLWSGVIVMRRSVAGFVRSFVAVNLKGCRTCSGANFLILGGEMIGRGVFYGLHMTVGMAIAG